MKELLLVSIGSFFGGGMRFWISKMVQSYTFIVFPFGTMTVNVLGCLIIGFLSGLSRGHDATSWINRCLDCFSEGLSFRRQSKKPKMKVHYGDKAKDYDYNARKKQQSEEIDRILDKLKMLQKSKKRKRTLVFCYITE